MKFKQGFAVLLLGSSFSAMTGCSDDNDRFDLTAPPATTTQAETLAVSAASFAGPVGDAGIHGHTLWDSPFDISEIGYVEEEYFVSGTARHHGGGPEAPYTTRVIVRRPAAAEDFNGTVILDWVNVTAQFENAVHTLEVHEFFHREGYAYVHVSAQAAGLCCAPLLTPQGWDPVRYA